MSRTSQPAGAHHFDDLQQQEESMNLGMWVFLATELMIFGGLFTAYVVYRYLYPVAFAAASAELNWLLAGVNTLVLITSSLTMALAVHTAQEQKHTWLFRYLALTAFLGLVFLGIKSFEYYEEYHHGLIPLPSLFHASEWPAGVSSNHVRLFFVLYFVMTGLHAVHMVAGIGTLGLFCYLTWRGVSAPEYPARIEMMGLYWHFVDVIWIFLLPLLYLIGTT